ncbi:MAG: RsmE family RNA methyltransferase [Pseudomonadales bacterium]
MHIPRVFIDRAITLSDVITLDGPKAHHLCHVLKLRNADPITIFNGCGGEFHGTVIGIKKDQLQARIERHDPVSRESQLRIILLLAILKKDPMRQALQRATELGVSEIRPIWTQHLSDRKSQSARRFERQSERARETRQDVRQRAQQRAHCDRRQQQRRRR